MARVRAFTRSRLVPSVLPSLCYLSFRLALVALIILRSENDEDEDFFLIVLWRAVIYLCEAFFRMAPRRDELSIL